MFKEPGAIYLRSHGDRDTRDLLVTMGLTVSPLELIRRELDEGMKVLIDKESE